MLIIQKLYIKDFFRVFFILSLGVSIIFSIISLIDKIDDFISDRTSFFMLFQYALFSIPKYFNYIMPLAVLLSSLFVFSQAVKRKEILIIKATGTRMKKILLPFLVIGVSLSFFAFFVSEIVIPFLTKEIHSIKNQLTNKSSNIAFRQGTVFMKGREGSVIRITLYLEDRDISHGISIYNYNENGLIEKIDAELAEWDGNLWRLKNVNIFNVSEARSIFIPELSSNLIESPKILKKEIRKAEEMTVIELIQYQKRLNYAGFKNNKLSVDISSRFSYPLINFFMMVLGLSLATGADNRLLQKILYSVAKDKNILNISSSGIIAVGLGLVISLIYWFGHTFFLSLGYADTIDPTISAWIMPLFFALGSLYLYKQIPE